MPEKVAGWAQFLGALIVVVLFTTLALVSAGGWTWFATFLEGSASNWVGAIGTILAIVGAVAIAQWQASEVRRDADRLRRKIETTRALSIDFMLRRAKLVVENARRNVCEDASSTLELARRQVEMVQHAVRGLPVFDIPSPRLVFDLQRVDRDLLYVLRLIEEASAPTRRRKIPEGVFARVQRRIDEARIAAVQVFDADALAEAHLTGIGSLWDDYDGPDASDKSQGAASQTSGDIDGHRVASSGNAPCTPSKKSERPGHMLSTS